MDISNKITSNHYSEQQNLTVQVQWTTSSVYSGTSNNGHSKELTTSLQRTNYRRSGNFRVKNNSCEIFSWRKIFVDHNRNEIFFRVRKWQRMNVFAATMSTCKLADLMALLRGVP